MGTAKKEKSRLAREGKLGSGIPGVKGENFYRTAKKVKTLNMRRNGGPQRNADGQITQAAPYQSRDAAPARIEPNRRWFTPTRVIAQDSLSAFRDAVAEKSNDPYQVLLKSNKLPMTLIRDGSQTNGIKEHKAKMVVETSSFGEVFGPKAQRKRVKMSFNSMKDFAADSGLSLDTYKERLNNGKSLSRHSGDDFDETGDHEPEDSGELTKAIEPIFSKGQSKRIWNELYKVLDSSDVVLHVLDARDPLGTRCRSVEAYLRDEAPHKHLVFLLNKCDLVPTSTAAAWVRHLSKEVPTLAFHSSLTNPFGKGSLIQLLRQFSGLHKDRKQISVGLIGYPNVGKSSIINTLRKKKVCTIAPIPGETKVWQYVTLMRRIYLIDCPGITPPNSNEDPYATILRGVVRVEKVEHPEQYIPKLMEKVKVHHLERTYDVKGWTSHTHFLELLARKGGRLLKGGEPDVDGVAKMVLTDCLAFLVLLRETTADSGYVVMRGKLPWFTPAPMAEKGDDKAMEGREGRLGEMPRKRKRDDNDVDVSVAALIPTPAHQKEAIAPDETGEEFEGFSTDDDLAPDEDAASKEEEDEDSGDDDDMIPLDELSDVEEDDESSQGEEEGKG